MVGAETAAAGEALQVAEEGEEGGEEEEAALPRGPGPLVALRDSDGGHYVLHRAVLAGRSLDLALLLRQLTAPRFAPPLWAVVLCRGGHFAAAVFQLVRPTQRGAPPRPHECATVLAHKTIHRYVTRRGQGGRQSSADGGKSINSAGSSLRRHNEVALATEARALLAEWAPLLNRAALLFAHAPGPANAAVLHANGGPVSKADPRLRRIPFATGRPTLEEAWRAVSKLASVDYIDPDASAHVLAAAAAASGADDPEALRWAAAEVAAAAEREMRRAAATAEAVAAAAALEAEAHAMPRELHDASAAGDAEAVAMLLVAGHDPTIRHIFFGFKPPYDVAKTGAVRDAFRRFRGCSPQAWHWERAHVPSGLSEEEESERRAREEVRGRERKRAAEKARKGRKKEDGAARAAAVEALVSYIYIYIYIYIYMRFFFFFFLLVVVVAVLV